MGYIPDQIADDRGGGDVQRREEPGWIAWGIGCKLIISCQLCIYLLIEFSSQVRCFRDFDSDVGL